MLRTTAVLMLMAMATTAIAQTQAPVTITEDFQSYGKSKKPNGWIDGKVGDLNAKPRGYYNTAYDPLGDKKGPNVVFGTNKSTGSEDEERNGKRIGWMSTYVDKNFSAAGRFELQGRMIEMHREARIGLVVLSGYPDFDRYYMIFDRKNAAGNLTMQLTSFGAGTPTGKLDSEFIIDPAKWYRFRIIVDDVSNATNIRARFWADGTAEPSGYQLDAKDSSPNRLKSGRFGMWAGGGKDNDDGKTDPEGQTRGVYIDDLSARSPSDTTPPVITFFENRVQLDPNTVPAFNHDTTIDIVVTDDLSTFTYTAQLDGSSYAPPVRTEGVHTLTVHAVDAPGNVRDATLRFLVDKTPPIISLTANGNALVNGTIFSGDVTLAATFEDISAVTSSATLNGNPVTLPLPVAEERNHELAVQAVDAAGNPASATRTFTLDKTAPVISVKANGAELSAGAAFRTDVTLTWTATDLTLNEVTATLDGAPIQSGHVVSVEGVHTLVVTATDRATHSTTETRAFALVKNAPAVTLLANGVAFEQDKTYNTSVRFTAVVQDPTPTTKVFTVDGQPYTENSPVTGDGLHNVKVVVTNAAGLSSTVGPFNFYIDTTAPSISMTESGQPFPDGAKFKRDVNPIVTATDNLTPNPMIVVTLDGHPYPTNAAVTEEKREHVISATATDDGGNSSSVGPFRFMLDKTKPVVTIANATTGVQCLGSGLFNKAVSLKISVFDITDTTTTATLNGAPFNLGSPLTQADGTIVFAPPPISSEGSNTFSVRATDEVGNDPSEATCSFTIDSTPPHITITEPQDNATVGTPTVTVAGGADDAVAITINGLDADVNMASHTFTIEGVPLLEGPNDIVADGVDAAGNRGTTKITVNLDTRVPELSITSPAADACIGTATLEMSGAAADPHLQSVNVTVDSGTPVAATISGGTWSASIPGLSEGKKLITVEATDSGGHTTSASRSITIDRSDPLIEVRNSGQLFTTTLTNRAVALFISAIDADPNVAITRTLDGSPYANGTSIATEGAHKLIVSAVDCAGHASQKTIDFTIDLTPPTIHNLNPANAATVGTTPTSISGMSDTDTATVEISGMQLVATPAANGSFTIPSVPFAEGSNRFTLIATDRAGNSSSLDYSVTVKTAAPVVEIRESGSPISAGALFNRTVTPIIRSADQHATIAATLNGAPFTSGTTITNDGEYTLHATATDTLGHVGSADATFTIDRTPPVVNIITPVESTLQTDHVEVRGTAGDAISATVNGQPVTLAADGSFVVPSFDLEVGLNSITATGRDRAGNTGRDEVVVTRDDLGGGIILTYPPDRSLTNRTTTDVIGRILNAARGTTVSIGGNNVAVDATGAFRVSGYTLTEGENTITATSNAVNGVSASTSTRVTADFTPPSLTIMESGQPLTDGVRFPERAVIALQAADTAGAVTTNLTIDGSTTTAPFTITANGGHSVTATARDLAGNETRSERTLFIGVQTGGGAQCQLDSFDPADGAVILSNTTTLIGRSGSAIGVKVNGVPAILADGAFWASVELPNEGPNTVTIICTDADGTATGTPVSIVLRRVTGDPSIALDTPAEGFVSAEESIAVTGSVGPGVLTADVNGVAATIAGGDVNSSRSFNVPAVRLATGLNVLVAHGRNAAGRLATASRRGLYLKDGPSINISAPTSGTTTGIPSVTVSGTYANLDPNTLTFTNVTTGQTLLSAQYFRRSDTTGSFAANLPLVNGDNSLRVTGKDQLNRMATATTAVRLLAGNPGIVISQPANHASFGGGSNSVAVSGTFQAAPGSTVDVNGVAATLNGSSYTAPVSFSTLAAGITPIVAAVTEPDGDSAFATIVVTQYADAPRVTESFPAPNSAEVDGGALMLVLFSQPMDASTLTSAFRLEDSNSSPVSGSLYVDKDVLTFAPATLLSAGGRYTIRVSTAAKNIAGTPIALEYTSGFTVASTASTTAPTVAPLGSAVCGQSITVNGTATPGARVRLESGTLMLNTTADPTGKFTFTYPMSGQSGFTVIRVRTLGSDGSISPAAELKVRVDCSGPSVLNANYDRPTNKLTIQFSEPIDAATATVGSNILLTLEDGRSVAGTATTAQALVTVTPAENLSAKTFSLTVANGVKDLIGNRLVTPHTQLFSLAGDQPTAGDGSGFISGEVYDATTGRPLPGASMTIDVASPTPVTTTTDARGRYLARLPEGAHTIKAALNAYTTVFREIIVPAGAGVIPIDIRLTRVGDTKTSTGSAMTLTHGGDSAVTKKVDLIVPAGAVANGTKISLTSVGGQALSGLLPLGWSPIGASEIVLAPAASTSPLQLTFNVPNAEISAAAQNLTAVQFDPTRDEWRVVVAAVNVGSDGKATIPVNGSGAYALVYPDKAPGLTVPPLPVAGDVLRGVPAAPADAPELVKHDFVLDPPVILPTGRAVGTLRIEGSGASFPSGTAVQANIDEELRLADGSRLLDPPFATDLLLYRTLSGNLGVADFHLAPTERAAQVVLETGVNHIRVFPYPGRLDRGTLIGSEGGRVPADDKIAVDIPSGAVPEPLRATAMSLTQSDLDAIGSVAGFRVIGGFQLTLQRASEPPPADLDGDGQIDTAPALELFVPARATFTAQASKLPAPSSQVILVELLNQTPFGRMLRLAVPMMPVDAAQTSTPAVRFTTRAIDRSLLPVDGVTHEGRYIVLAAESPIAFATGTVRLASSAGRLLSDARVLTPSLGVADITRTSGIYNLPVPARPAAPFTLVPRHITTGDGAAYTHTTAVDPDAVVRVDLLLTPQPPTLTSVVVLKGNPPSQGTLTLGTIASDVALTTNIRASFAPSIDPTSVNADSIIVTDAIANTKVNGSAAADGTVAVVWTLTAGEKLKPNGRYSVSISPSIRGVNGATLARAYTFTFNTVTQILNNEVHKERIRITIPGPDGVSKIVGDPGALPAGWQAVAVRRGRDFIVRYQATAAADGSFAFFIGNGGDEADKITIGDLIDLQVISNIGNVAAIFALTPFASEDGKSFVVPAGSAVTYTTPEGFTLGVPAGAFDKATVVSMVAVPKEQFQDIPSVEADNVSLASVKIDFDGTSKKPLILEAPLPQGYDPNAGSKVFFLTEKYNSVVGPRLAIIDLVRVDGNKVTNAPDPNELNNLVTVRNLKTGTNLTLTGSRLRNYCRFLMGSGIYMHVEIRQPIGGAVGIAVMNSLQAQYDMIWDIYDSYISPYVHVFETGGALMPVVQGRRFTVTGIDPGTGLQAFKRTYDPIPSGPPGVGVEIPNPQFNDGGPYPVFGGPFRVETLDLDVEDVEIRSIRNFTVKLSNGIVKLGQGSSPLKAGTKVYLLNVSRGTMISGTSDSQLALDAKVGNRIALLIEQHEVDPRSNVSIVFNEPIFAGTTKEADEIDTFLHTLIKVEYSQRLLVPSFSDITSQVRFETDSGGRRVNVIFASALQSEALYRITLSQNIADVVNNAPGLTLGQGTVDNQGIPEPVGGGNPLQLFFDVRKPAGDVATFKAVPTNGFIRGMDLSGNILMVAAWDGGLHAYDMSNPAALTGSVPPVGSNPGPPNSASGTLSVIIDRHNRVFTTEMGGIAGTLRSYRLEDFANGITFAPMKSSAVINWKMGFSNNIGLVSNTVLSDVPESIPFRIKLLSSDDEQNFKNRDEFIAGTGAMVKKNYPDEDLQSFDVEIGKADTTYKIQRMTIENISLEMRWSADATDSTAAKFTNVIARPGDKMRFLRNQKTYAVVAHLGYGIGLYDVNGMESNKQANLCPKCPGHIQQKLILTSGKIDFQCPNKTPDYANNDNYITTDAELRGDPNDNQVVYALFTDNYRGVLDLQLRIPTSDGAPGTRDDDCEQRPNPNTGGLLFRTTPPGFEAPRTKAVAAAFTAAAGRAPFATFSNLARYHWSVTAAENTKGLRGTGGGAAERDYLLVAGGDYGLLVVDIDSNPTIVQPYPLTNENIADVIWIPGGVISVRVYQSANVALVGDRYGRALLVDLTRIDERFDGGTGALFPTVGKALLGQATDPYGVGADDPRILWKSEPGVVGGSVAPVFDPATGLIYAGNGQNVKVLSALDPKVQVKVNLGETSGLSDVGGIVPLGIAPPPDIQQKIDGLPSCATPTSLTCKDNASLAAFRLEVALPGNLSDALTQSNGELQLAVESERVAGAITEQTPDGFPRAHLRRTRRNGSAETPDRVATNFKMKRLVPEELRSSLKTQGGYNRFVSPWIVAIADPRASREYEWGNATKQAKKEAGCEECERPQHLKDKKESDGVYELWTNGRFISVRPELKAADLTIFADTKYAYLGTNDRLLGRFSTIMADTVRPTEVLVAAQTPPIANGMLQETTYLHSGELQSTAIDFNAGGRAGIDVVFHRTYRSRTIGGTTFGQGWDSALLRRLRALPSGDVEFRDGAEVWRFKVNEKRDGYDSPKGLFLKLSRTARGWKLTDQAWRVAEFDDLGRMLSDTDEFFDPQTPGSGNIIRYVYDDSGRLSDITDPVQRRSTLTYWNESDAGQSGAYPGLIKQIADWRNRRIDYSYDGATGTLTKVQLPQVSNMTPAVQYTYTPAGATYNDVLELRTNLQSIIDPHEVATSGPARVTFGYGSGGSRDRVVSQQWGTGESASFTYSGPDVTTVDALGQTRKHKLTAQGKDYFADRAHFESVIESAVPTSSTAFGQLPSLMTPSEPATTPVERTANFTYYPDGMVDTARLVGVRQTKFNFGSAQGAPGFVLNSVTTSPDGGSGETITQSFGYQSGPNLSTFLQSTTANGKKIDAPQPSRNNKTPQSVNSSINATETYDASGLPRKYVSSGGVDPDGAGSDIDIQYNLASDPGRHRRGLASEIKSGGLKTSVLYPSPEQTVETDARGIVTTTDYDSWNRPVHISVAGPEMTVDERFEYDATGRLRKHVRKQGSMDVTTNYDYDVMGRRTLMSVDNVANTGTITTKTTYDLKTRTITTDKPGDSKTTVKLDPLGRTASSVTTTGGSPIADFFAYDLADNLVFRTDLLIASASAYDAHGRRTGLKAPDDIEQITEFDSWGRPRAIREFDTAGAMFGESTFDYTDGGQLQSVLTKVDAAQIRETRYAWDGGGRTTGMSESGRASHSRFDAAGRYLSGRSGSGDAQSVTTPFTQMDVSGHAGPLPQSIQSREKTGSAYQRALQYNTAADVTAESLGDLEWKQGFDQAGNRTSSKSPNRPGYAYDFDSRGSVKQETLPGGATNKYNYHATGSLTDYTDPSNEVTQTIPDLLGRPTERVYRDGTREKIVWEGRRVKSITDRQGRLQTFNYNLKGQIETITVAGDVVLDRIAYDPAGRIVRWTNDDSIIEYSNYDFDGHPRLTTQSRYRNGVLVDQYTQEHTWNVHSERSSWTMPTYTGFNSDKPWTKSISQDHDAMGNIIRMQRTLAGQSAASTFFDADYRNAGRPNERTITTPAGKQIVRTYGYDGNTSQLNLMAVSANGATVAGSSIIFDGLQKFKASLLGLSGGARLNQWQYDGRSRLQRSVLARDSDSALQTEGLSAADFRNAFTRPPTTPVDPPSVIFTESGSGGHKIDKVERGQVVEQFTFTGGERTGDGRFTYQYDVKGRLIAVTDKATVPPIRRVLYSYDGNDRMIGRRAEYATVENPTTTDWKLEDRPSILSADGLPADTTFVWDPVSDRLVALFKAGASLNPTIDANGGLLRQIIHGGSDYDDPLEVTTVDVTAPSGVGHLYPVYDEAGAGSLQAILNVEGQVVSRNMAGGPYGEDETVLMGPAVDKVSIKAKKSDGALDSVEVLIRATEEIAEASLTAGVRLATVNAAGAAVRTSNKVPEIVDGSKIQWTLTAAEWNALIDSSPATVNGQALTPAAVSIAVTNTLRAGEWSAALPFLPAPVWAVTTKPVYTSATLPVEVRESLANLSQWLASIGSIGEKTTSLYEVPNLLALGTPRLGSGGAAQLSGDPQLLIVSSGFHAHPFQDPMTGRNYVRARWFDTQNGVWLTPDPAGYADSPNLYAYASADPVNASDPTGNCWDLRKPECRVFWSTLDREIDTGLRETGRNILTLGIYGGIKEAREKGEDESGWAVAYAGAKGLQKFWLNTVTFGYASSLEEKGDDGSVKHWLGTTTGASDLSQCWTDVWRDGDLALGGLRCVEGATKVIGLVAAAKSGVSKAAAARRTSTSAAADAAATRPKFWNKTKQTAFDEMPSGPTPDTRTCPTCGKVVTGKVDPATGKIDIQIDHFGERGPWVERQARARKEGWTRQQVIEDYQEGTRGLCARCNAQDGGRLGAARKAAKRQATKPKK